MKKYGFHHVKHVRIKGRHFIVKYDKDDKVIRIMERKKIGRWPGLTYMDVQFWTERPQSKLIKNCLAKRVLTAAELIK